MLGAKKLLMASSFLTLLVAVAVVNTAVAESTTFHNPEVTTHLKDFRSSAAAMRDEADALKSMTRNKNHSWQSHTDRLTTLKKHVNEMGKSLADLEEQQVIATDQQALAIEQARLHLVPVAETLTQAIELVNERRTNVHWDGYGDAVNEIYAHADALHTKLDTILDYEDARLRFDRLELQPAFIGGE
jgi:septal ring factor EnvC (AmiA/AmiB activator)